MKKILLTINLLLIFAMNSLYSLDNQDARKFFEEIKNKQIKYIRVIRSGYTTLEPTFKISQSDDRKLIIHEKCLEIKKPSKGFSLILSYEEIVFITYFEGYDLYIHMK